MADDLSTFPLVLAIREDGSVDSVVDSFERNIGGATARVASGFETIARNVRALQQQTSQKIADPLGIKAAVQSLSSSPLQKVLNEQASAESALAQQRTRASAERVAAIGREFDAAMSGIRGEQAARTAAFAQAEREGLALVSLQQQRVAEMARTVAGPQQQSSQLYYDPQGSAQAATAARAQAVALGELARNAEVVAAATRNATAADRAFAATARDAATAAGIEASRLEEVAATQGRVAAAALAAGGKTAAAGDLVAASVRGQRFATIQASQQFQDFFIQIQGGQNPLVAFSQQASQLAFVMANTGGETGKFARFIGGPWGTLIFAGLSVLTLLTAGLFDNKKASSEAEEGAKKFADRQGDLKNFISETTGALVEQNKTLVLNAVLTRQAQIAANDKEISEGRKAAIKAANKTLTGNTGPLNEGTGDVPVLFRQDPQVQNAVRAAKGDVDLLAQSIAALAKKRPDLKALSLEISNQAGEAIVAAQENKRLNRELAAIGGDRNSSFTSASAVSGLVAIAAATDKYSRRIAELTERRRELGVAVDRGDFTGKGGRDHYIAEAAAIDKQIAAQQKLKSESEKTGRSGKADANRVAGQRRQELFADAAAIGDGTDAIRAANSTYAAEITRLRNQLREGLISDDAARDSAIKARQIRNAAVDTAQGAKALDAALQRIGQEFDGDSRFVNRIEKAQAAVADALARIDEVTGTAQIGENEYSRDDLLEKQKRLREAMVRPITDANRQLDEQAQIDAAILAGREDEADFLRQKFQILQQYGELTATERADIEALLSPLRGLITAEKDRNVEIERRSQLINAQVAAARRVQDALTSFIEKPFAKDSLKDLGGSLTQSRQKSIADELSIKLFGDMGSDVYRALTRNNQPTVEAAGKLRDAARDLSAAASLIGSAANDNPSVAERSTTPTAFGLNPGVTGGAAYTDPVTGDIVVNATRGSAQGGQRDPFAYDLLGEIGKTGANIGDLAAGAKRQASIQRAATIGLSFAAQAIGGKTGKAINAGLNVSEFSKLGRGLAKDIGGPIGKAVGGVVAGAGQGLFADSVVKMFGIKGSATGGAVGGAIGSALPIPGGALIGGAIGSIIGGLFKKTKYGTAALSGGSSNGGFSLSSNSGSAGAAAGSLGEAVQSGIASIAEQLGGVLGDFSVSIGTYKDKYRVSTTGYTGKLGNQGGKTDSLGIVDFGTDGEEAAIRFAIADAIKDGAVQGLRAGTQRLISLGGDMDRQLQKALSFEGVFRELKALRDPIGAATDDIDKQLANLRKVFDEAGASSGERAQLEELYALKRVDAVKQAQEQLTGQLKSLLDDLKFKGDTGLSLRTRETNAMTALNPLIAQIQAGKTVDQGEFADKARAFLDIERDLYGSTETYFQKLAQITDLTARAIGNTGAGNVVPISDAVRSAMAPASAAAIAALVPPVDTASIVAAVQAQTAAVTAQTNAMTSRIDLLTRVTANNNRPFDLQIANGKSTLSSATALRNA